MDTIAELKTMNCAQLGKQVLALSKDLVKLRMQKGVDTATVKTHEFIKARRQRARVLTILAQKKHKERTKQEGIDKA
jgi:ribosomal protein L29